MTDMFGLDDVQVLSYDVDLKAVRNLRNQDKTWAL